MEERLAKKIRFVGRVAYLIAALLALATLIQVRFTGPTTDVITLIGTAIWFLAVGGAIGLWME